MDDIGQRRFSRKRFKGGNTEENGKPLVVWREPARVYAGLATLSNCPSQWRGRIAIRQQTDGERASCNLRTMIVTDHFVYIHVSRTAGTFLGKLILEQVPGARRLQYHGHLQDLPEEYRHLPVVGFVRNPWDWYISMFHDYRRKRQFVFRVISEGGALGFEQTIARFLNLGDGSAESAELLRRLAAAPPRVSKRGPDRLPGLSSEHFRRYPAAGVGVGYFGWLLGLMFRSERERKVRLGRFECLREDTLRLFEETGAPVTKGVAAYLRLAPALNASHRPERYADAYGPELRNLVAKRESTTIDRFGYAFS